MAKADHIYFENLNAAAQCACTAADYLVECMTAYNPEQMQHMLDTMHTHEHEGDTKKHEMTRILAKAFVTPIDREDLALISQNIDEVTDSIEEVLQAFYMYRIKTITPEAITFARKLTACCQKMMEMLGEFENFKRPQKLHELVVELNRMEEDCDTLYMDSTMHLDSHFESVLDIISWREIYNRMENCADACEHVGDSVDLVVMKNS